MKQIKKNIRQIKTPVITSVTLYLIILSYCATANNDINHSADESPKDDDGHDLSHLFLRDSEVLLNPKEIQLSVGFNYTTNKMQKYLRKVSNRSMGFPIDISYGLSRRFEVNASIPFTYIKSDTISNDSSSSVSNSGMGDISFGFSYKMKPESLSVPSVTTSLSIIAPTGQTTDPNDFTDISTGSGFWGISTNLSLSKSIDPSVLFLSIGYQHTFADDQYGYEIHPGDIFSYGFGSGFAVNNLIAFSGRISGAYQKNMELDKTIRQGTGSEQIYIIWSLSYRIANNIRLESTLNQGVSNDADDVGIGFFYIWNL
jgi:hypothetical protein